MVADGGAGGNWLQERVVACGPAACQQTTKWVTYPGGNVGQGDDDGTRELPCVRGRVHRGTSRGKQGGRVVARGILTACPETHAAAGHTRCLPVGHGEWGGVARREQTRVRLHRER